MNARRPGGWWLGWRVLVAAVVALLGAWFFTLPILLNCHEPSAATDVADCKERASSAVGRGVTLMLAAVVFASVSTGMWWARKRDARQLETREGDT